VTIRPARGEWATRARSFGAVAREYDRARPSYPDALVDDVVAELPGRDVVDVGAGTGKATVLFAARGLRITCIEPDDGMAAVLAENCSALPEVEIVVSSFEEWQPTRLYDGLYAAQSWHWTAPEHRYRNAARSLREGGVLALFWNGTDWDRTPLAEVIDNVYRRHGLLRDDRPKPSRDPGQWPLGELRALDTFSDIELRTYPSTATYTSQEWCDYAASTSEHLILEPGRNAALLADLRRTIDREGGTVEISRHCDLFMARRSATPA
jgi:SAM-dependent methyltransferase